MLPREERAGAPTDHAPLLPLPVRLHRGNAEDADHVARRTAPARAVRRHRGTAGHHGARRQAVRLLLPRALRQLGMDEFLPPVVHGTVAGSTNLSPPAQPPHRPVLHRPATTVRRPLHTHEADPAPDTHRPARRAARGHRLHCRPGTQMAGRAVLDRLPQPPDGLPHRHRAHRPASRGCRLLSPRHPSPPWLLSCRGEDDYHKSR